jgi:general stress protein YciG
MTVREAGRRGGEKVKAIYGVEHFERIGQKGAATLKARLEATEEGSAGFFSRIGRMSGETVRAQQADSFFADIGRKGGEALAARRGPAYYSAIGKAGAAARSKKRLEAAA